MRPRIPALPGEEAHQLPTGKRVVSRPTFHSIKLTETSLNFLGISIFENKNRPRGGGACFFI
ncbi:hypothetical protein GCM10011389_09430 [Pontibacillus salipaludis]|uniref:Uncharacterized protein n=1 Tax=Pontibacillus salipaludis TaxID=1697394 RepID=A0ABQ1PUH3_9BACI|nr:hypothetical protein GCM10011389_09430 [Pontibacillus salipaludis]